VDESKVNEMLDKKRRFLETFGVKVFADDPEPRYKRWKMPLDGGIAVSRRHMRLRREICLTPNDKFLAGYPLEERAKDFDLSYARWDVSPKGTITQRDNGTAPRTVTMSH